MAEPSVASYPSSYPIGDWVNNKILSVSGSHDASVTTITTSATVSGVNTPFYAVNGTTGEIIYVEGTSGADLTPVVRGADGSTAQPMSGGQLLHVIVVANMHNQLVREMDAMINAVSTLELPVLAVQIFS